MIEKLVVDFFNTIEEKEGIDSINGKADFLTKELLEKNNGKFNYISNKKATRLYLKYVEKRKDISVSLNDKFLKDIIANYLGYDNYQEFVADNFNDKAPSKSESISAIKMNRLFKKNKVPILVSAVTILIIVLFNSLQQQRWMVWEKDHYKEVPLDLKKYHIKQLQRYNEKLIKSFKKINAPDCNMEYLNTNGTAKVWYWKKNNEEIEIFTTAGLHPINGKTLKPITRHMIRKYLCKD